MRVAALWVEAAICYGVLAMLLYIGLPRLGIALLDIELARQGFGDYGQLAIVAMYVGGVAGLVGASMLVVGALGSEARVRFPRTTVFCVCAGAAALGAGVTYFGLNVVLGLLVPLTVTSHFVYLTRRSFVSPDASAPVRYTFPHAPVLLSLVIGLAAGSERFGIRASYDLDEAVTADRVEVVYRQALTDLSGLASITDAEERARAQQKLVASLRTDPTIVMASVHVELAGGPRETLFSYSTTNAAAEICVRRSTQRVDANLIRCRLEISGNDRDVLKLTKPVAAAVSTGASITLKIDYPTLLQRLEGERG